MTRRRALVSWMASLRGRRYAERQRRLAEKQRNVEERNEMRAKGVIKGRMPPSGGMGY